MFALSVAEVAVVSLAFAHTWADLLASPRLHTRAADLDLPALTVIVPARDEALNIDGCLTSLRASDYPHLEIVVVDDRSTDGTAEAVRRHASTDARVRLIEGAERPDGWQGKSWALDQGVRAASGAWLAMVDADVTVSPRALRGAVALAEARGVALLSLLPRLRDETFWERVIQPVIGLFVFLCQPLWLARAPGSAVAVANGQFLLVERGAYGDAGGHRAVKEAIVEDVELARRYKRLGLPVLITPAFADVEVRMYRGFAGIWRGWGKTIHPYVAAQPVRLWLGIVALLAVFWSPFIALPIAWALEASPGVVVAQAISCGLVLANAMAFRLVSRHELGHGVFWPLAILVLLALFVARTAGALCGGGVTWKGRRYA